MKPGIKKLWAVALYEAKSLMRSKVFIVYCFTAFLFLLISSVMLNASWTSRCISSFIPYMLSKNFITVQAVMAVMLATECIAGDMKLNSIDSVYARSMTNTGYIIGKFLAITLVFLVVNSIYFLFGGIANLVLFSDSSLSPVSYVLYPLLLIFPALVFIFGLSLLVTTLFRIRAITITILTGYIAIVMFYIGDNYYYIFDFPGIRMPFTFSDFTGFGNLPLLLVHRMIYLLAGLGCILVTILLQKRLPQSMTVNRLSIIFAVLCLTGTFYLCFRFHDIVSSGAAFRRDMNELSMHLAEKPQVSVTDCDLDLIHHGDEIAVEAKIKLKNLNKFPVDQLIFCLNPGLEVIKVESNDKELNFERNLHILSVEPQGKFIQSDKTDSLVVHYRGKINEEACYAAINENERRERNRIFNYTIEKRYSVITLEYVLLTHENMWYPSTEVPDGSDTPQTQNKDFVNFKLTVSTDRALIAVSQGHSEKTGDGKYIFTSEVPLSQLSLVIGDYEKKSIIVDEIEYSIYVKKGHDFFSQHFTNIGDKLPETIRRLKQEFEFRINIDYPFQRFSLVEVPVQFFAYQSDLRLSPATVQPEQLFISEKGVFTHISNLRRLHRMVTGHPNYKPETRTPMDIEGAMLHYFAKNNFLEISRQRQWIKYIKQNMSETGISADKLGLGYFTYPSLEYNYNIYPNYYNFKNCLSSDRFPVIDSVIGHYLKTKLVYHPYSSINRKKLMPDKFMVIKALSQHSLNGILTGTDTKSKAYEVLQLKTEDLFRYICIKNGIDKEELDSFLVSFLSENRFKTVDAQDFNAAVNNRFDIDFESYLDRWYNQKELPRYKAWDIKQAEIYVNGEKKNQVLFTIQNISDTDGVVYAMMGDMQGTIGERYVAIKGNETKQVGMIVDRESTYGIRIDPFISQHYFYLDNFLDTYRADNNAVPFDGERVINAPVKSGPAEIVVDNLDSGFQIVSQPEKSFLMKYLSNNINDDINEFKAFQKRIPPVKWKYGFFEHFYGDPETSAYYIKSGKGKCSIEWKAMIPEQGNYDIYYYTPHHEEFRIPNPKKIYSCTDFNFLIHHDEGVDEVTLDVSDTQKAWTNSGDYTLKGWTLLGTYYLSEGTAKVELSDKSTGALVYADAVKWVKK
ncbi:hypothetical protein ACFL60_06490 [Candidatus Omnitrophota bacterium]